MKTLLRTVVWLLVILVVGLPLTFITTILLAPLWSWIEATYGIESIGHSGPADWCFGAILGLYLLVCALIFWLYRRKQVR